MAGQPHEIGIRSAHLLLKDFDVHSIGGGAGRYLEGASEYASKEVLWKEVCDRLPIIPLFKITHVQFTTAEAAIERAEGRGGVLVPLGAIIEGRRVT